MEFIFFLILSALLIWLVYWLVDSSGPTHSGHGVVVGKKFTKGYWQTNWITRTDGDGTTSSNPEMNWIPDSYALRLILLITSHINQFRRSCTKISKKEKAFLLNTHTGAYRLIKFLSKKLRDNIIRKAGTTITFKSVRDAA